MIVLQQMQYEETNEDAPLFCLKQMRAKNGSSLSLDRKLSRNKQPQVLYFILSVYFITWHMNDFARLLHMLQLIL